MINIGEFSKLNELSIDTLYHYEKMKILIPLSVDVNTGYRYYDAAQLAEVNKIIALKDAGFTLEEILNIIRDDISTPLLIEMLEDKARLFEANLKNEYNRLERLNTNIFLIKNGGVPYMNGVSIKKVEPILVASMRRTFPKSDFDINLEEMWPEVNNYIDKNRIKRVTPCLMLYHSGWWDMEEWGIMYDPHNLDIEVAEPVTAAFEGNGDINAYMLPMVKKMACIVHNGPFSAIGKTCDILFEWISQNNYFSDGPVREIYHKGEWATDNPDEYITELQIPLKQPE